MPLYEYRCRDCEKTFEQFVSGKARPACPHCESRSLQKLLSVFAVASGGSRAEASAMGAACGSCGDPRGPGSCAVN
jgi:putative FmdB family regulatory protein